MNTLSPLIERPGYTLSFRMKLPAPAAPRALLVLLHGVGGNEGNLAELGEPMSPDTLVVFPRGPLALGPGRHAWFRVTFGSMGPRIVPSEAEASRITLIRFVAQLQAAFGVATERTVIAGFSQGGILSASVGLSSPESVGGFGVLAGRILPELEPHLASRERLKALRAWIAHGRDDDKLPVAWAERADAWLEQLGVTHEARLYAGGHGISVPMAQDFTAWARSITRTDPRLTQEQTS